MHQQILRALLSLRTPLLTNEYQLHDLIATALERNSIPFIREARLGPYARVDFLCADVALEAKKGRPDRELLVKQLSRYAGYAAVSSLIVITESSVRLPGSIASKPVSVIILNRLWGVAL